MGIVAQLVDWGPIFKLIHESILKLSCGNQFDHIWAWWPNDKATYQFPSWSRKAFSSYRAETDFTMYGHGGPTGRVGVAKTIGFFLETWQSYIPIFKLIQESVLKLSCGNRWKPILPYMGMVAQPVDWGPPKIFGFFLEAWQSYIRIFKLIRESVLKLSCGNEKGGRWKKKQAKP